MHGGRRRAATLVLLCVKEVTGLRVCLATMSFYGIAQSVANIPLCAPPAGQGAGH